MNVLKLFQKRSSICLQIVRFQKRYGDFFNQSTEVDLPDLTPESAFFGLGQSYDNLSNHIHLIFKKALYNSRQKEVCSINYLKKKIIASKKLESNMTFFDNNKRTKNFQKWRRCPDSILRMS